MRQRGNVKSVDSRVQIATIVVLICILSVGSGKTQEQTHATCDKGKVRERVSTIIRETLKQGENRVNGIIAAWTRIPPSNEAIEEMRCYGDVAVPVLVEHLNSKDDRKKELAIRFLGELGGSQIVEPPRMIVQYETSSLLRNIAVRWLTEAPWDLASPIIQQAAQNDPDPSVRQTAQELLDARKPR